MNKVYGGTPKHDGTSLCVNCIYATIISGLALSSERVYCGHMEGDTPMPQPIIKCNRHHNKASPTLRAMEEIAWSLRTNHAGKAIGFVSPKDARWQKSKLEE